MKSKLLIPVFLLLFAVTNVKAQYKDLEGVFFGKVIAFGAGASFQSYAEKQIGSQTSVTPLNYSVILSNKSITSFRLALHNRFEIKYQGNDGVENYTQTAKFKFWEYEVAGRGALTTDGIEKPTSVFYMLQVGLLAGKKKIEDSRYGEIEDDADSQIYFGGGLTLYQRLGGRTIFFAEPAYRFVLQPRAFKTYLGDNEEMNIKLSHLNVHVGVMFLIGKSK